MTTTPKKRPILFSILFAASFFLIHSFIPLWQGPNRYKDGNMFARSSFWEAAHYLLTSDEGPGFWIKKGDMIGLFIRNLFLLAIVLAIGYGFGRLFYFIMWDKKPKW